MQEAAPSTSTKSELIIGIDLGTTNSCAACLINNKLKILENFEGDRLTPSFVFYPENNVAVAGKNGKRMARARPEFGIYEIKRLVGRTFDDSCVRNSLPYFPFKVINKSNMPVLSLEQSRNCFTKTPQEVCALILKKIKKDVESKLGDIEKVVITVPAYFNVTQRQVTRDAATDAGFTVMKLISEPVAAATSFYWENSDTDGYSFVYDLGGGTFDVAILKRDAGNITTIAVDGDTHLGGHDFDNLIIDYVCQELMKLYDFDPKPNSRLLNRLLEGCKEAKEMLSVVEDTSIILDGFVPGIDCVEIPFTRNTFQTLTFRLLKKTLDIVNNCVCKSNIPKTDIKHVILAGGSTRIPKIQEMLRAYFGDQVFAQMVNPDECVAEGAAIQAAMMSNHPQQQSQHLEVTEVIPLSLGVDDLFGSMDFVIQRNTAIPVTRSIASATVEDQQPMMTFDIYEGERLKVSGNRHLGSIYLSNLTAAPPGQCIVTLTMSVDRDGILTVTAKEKCSDNVKDLQINYGSRNLSDNEVNNLVEDAIKHQEEDELFMIVASKKLSLLNYCNKMIYNLESGNLISSNVECYNKCKETQILIGNMDEEDEEEIDKLVEELTQICDPVARQHKFI